LLATSLRGRAVKNFSRSWYGNNEKRVKYRKLALNEKWQNGISFL
jgi:hypothetical protein